jgi:hypothetical protein
MFELLAFDQQLPYTCTLPGYGAYDIQVTVRGTGYQQTDLDPASIEWVDPNE